MKFFIDTADINEIRQAKELGILDGITTNPSLVSKTGKPYKEVLETIAKEVSDVPMSAEVISTNCDSMVKEARELAAIGKNINIKIPLIDEGLKAVKILTEEGIKTNVTLCFNAVQALLAARAGATYVSPFIGRLDDIGADGMEVVEEILTVFDNYGLTTQIIAASIRHPMHVKQAALIGAHIATIPFDVLKRLINHPLTDIGLEKFLQDYKKING